MRAVSLRTGISVREARAGSRQLLRSPDEVELALQRASPSARAAVRAQHAIQRRALQAIQSQRLQGQPIKIQGFAPARQRDGVAHDDGGSRHVLLDHFLSARGERPRQRLLARGLGRKLLFRGGFAGLRLFQVRRVGICFALLRHFRLLGGRASRGSLKIGFVWLFAARGPIEPFATRSLFGSFWSGWLRGEIPLGQRRPARGRLRASICVGRLGGCFFGAADRDAVNGRARPVRRGSISSPAPRVHEVVFVSFVALRVRQVLQTWESGNLGIWESGNLGIREGFAVFASCLRGFASGGNYRGLTCSPALVHRKNLSYTPPTGGVNDFLRPRRRVLFF